MTVRKMKSKLMLAGVLAVFTLGGAFLRLAWATPSLGVTTTILSGPVMLEEST